MGVVGEEGVPELLAREETERERETGFLWCCQGPPTGSTRSHKSHLGEAHSSGTDKDSGGQKAQVYSSQSSRLDWRKEGRVFSPKSHHTKSLEGFVKYFKPTLSMEQML